MRISDLRYTPDEIQEFLSRLDNLYTNIVVGKGVVNAIPEAIDMIDKYKSMYSDILNYKMWECKKCGHFNLKDDEHCHVCGNPKEWNK